MPVLDLLLSQRNDVFLLLQEEGLSPAEFRWQEAASRHSKGYKVPQLLHESSNYYFRFDMRNGTLACQFSPSIETLHGEGFPGDWANQRRYFKSWAVYLKREVGVPDLWASIEQSTALFGGTRNSDELNALFTTIERTRIASGINEIRSYFAASHPDGARVDFVEERLNYLIESSSRLGRKDFINVALGVLTNLVVGAALTPDAARELLRVAGGALGWLFGVPHLLGG